MGLIIDSTLKWGSYIEQLINRLSSLCYVVRQIKPYMSQTTLITIYYSPFQSIMSYGIIFWGNSTHSSKIFKIQKRAIGIIMGKRSRDSCRNFFKELKIWGMFKKRPNFLNSTPYSIESTLLLLGTPSVRFWRQTAICPISLWALVVELHSLKWAHAQAIHRISDKVTMKELEEQHVCVCEILLQTW